MKDICTYKINYHTSPDSLIDLIENRKLENTNIRALHSTSSFDNNENIIIGRKFEGVICIQDFSSV